MGILDQVNALENGKGIQHLIDAGGKIFKNPIAMFDTNYNLKAYTELPSDDPLWNELVSTGTFSMQTQEFFAKECFTEEVTNADKLVILKSNKLKQDRILGNVFNRDHIKVANIVMVGLDTLAGADDNAAFEKFADKVSNEIYNDEYYTAYGKEFHESIIVRLLDGIIKDPIIYSPHVQILYDGFDDYLFVAVVDIAQNNLRGEDLQNKLLFFKDKLENKYQFIKYAIYSGYIVMIISSKYNAIYEEQFFNTADNPFKQNGLFVGVSDGFENLYELRKYYDQAVTTLENGIKKNDGKWFFKAAGS